MDPYAPRPGGAPAFEHATPDFNPYPQPAPDIWDMLWGGTPDDIKQGIFNVNENLNPAVSFRDAMDASKATMDSLQKGELAQAAIDMGYVGAGIASAFLPMRLGARGVRDLAEKGTNAANWETAAQLREGPNPALAANVIPTSRMRQLMNNPRYTQQMQDMKSLWQNGRWDEKVFRRADEIRAAQPKGKQLPMEEVWDQAYNDVSGQFRQTYEGSFPLVDRVDIMGRGIEATEDVGRRKTYRDLYDRARGDDARRDFEETYKRSLMERAGDR